MYNAKSTTATEFISDSEIRSTIDYARDNHSNRELIESILAKAAEAKGITHREAALLLECDDPAVISRIYSLANEIKHRFYGNRIVMFAPLYLSNYCVNGCVYCPYHAKNKNIRRKKLTQEEIRAEVMALQNMGHKRLALEAGEHPLKNPIEYILESIDTIYSIKHKNGAIRRVNVNIAATTVDNYRRLRDAGIGTYILFQETYNKDNYEALHPTGPKSDYAWHTEAMDRAMRGGIDDVGIGVLFGLETYRYDFVGLLMHAEHLEATYGVGPHTISVPRLCQADDVDTADFENAVPDDIKWNIAYSNGEMMIYPNSDDENWLYCTSGSNNNSVRIGTNADNSIFEMKTVEINDVVYSDYLYNKTTERFVGAYYDDGIAVDWRAYKLTASGAFPTNIKNQEYHFFRSEGTNTYCTDVDIPQSQSITADVTMGNVSLMNRIVIESGATLTIDGIIACTNAENLVIKDGAQLVHNTPGVNATLEKEIEGYGSTNAGWYTISSPIVGNANLSDVENLTTNNYDLYRYDESTSMWQNVKEQTNNFTTLETGRGYLYANENDATLSFIGELSCESVVYFLSKTENSPLPGFHLIGNPFSHNIYKGKGAAVDDDNLVPGYYVLSNSGAWGARISNETPITPCQSILVKTIDECDIKIKKTNSTPSEKNENNDVMVISVENADYEDVAYVLFDGSVGLEN